MNPRLRSAMQIWVSGVFIALMVLRAGAEKQSNEPEFSSTVQEVLKALRANDKKVFSGFISKNGIELTYVEKNWGLSGRVLPKPKQTHKDPFFNRGKIPPTVWTIYNVKIPKEELIKDKLAKEDFNQACQKFGSLIRDTQKNYPNSVSYSLNMVGIRERQYLGPAVVGKLASNAIWCIYFTNESGSWRVWRLEYSLR